MSDKQYFLAKAIFFPEGVATTAVQFHHNGGELLSGTIFREDKVVIYHTVCVAVLLMIGQLDSVIDVKYEIKESLLTWIARLFISIMQTFICGG